MNDEKTAAVTLGELCSIVKASMIEKFSTGQGRMKHYRHAFSAISKGCGGDDVIYNPERVEAYVNATWEKHQQGTVGLARFQIIRKSAALLDEYYRTSTLEWRQLPPKKINRQFCTVFSDVLAKYGEKMKPKIAPSTWKNRANLAARLMLFLESKGHKDFSNVTTEDIWAYIFSISDQNTSSMGNVLAGLRGFSSFLHEGGISPANYVPSLEVSAPKKRRVIPGFTIEEADKVVDAADRSDPLGKRDYAMLLLSQFTGLRGVDIINLKRSDVNWRTEAIHIMQQKNHKPLTISFEAVVGNAIADYILNGRPDSDSPYIFLKHCSPFTKLADVSAPNIAKKHLGKAEIPHPAGARRGFHCFRRSLGERLLDAETPMQMISQILGQSDPDSVRSYLHTAADKLRLCAISLSGIEVEMEGLL